MTFFDFRASFRLLVVAGLGGLAASGQGAPTDEGRQLFLDNCAACHGPNGEGGRGPTLAQPSLPRAPDLAGIKRIIVAGIPGTEMPSFRIEAHSLPLLVAYVKSLGSLPQEKLPGEPDRGAELFSGKGSCVTCHSVHGRGGAVGPDLTAIGARRSAAYLRKALTDPAAQVPQSYTPYRAEISLPENFLFVRLTTRDGQAVAGVRVNEDTFSIQVRDLAGQLHSFSKADLTELHKDWGFTPMPPYGAVFTPGEMDDLVAYLASLRGKPAAESERSGPALLEP